MGLYQLLFRNWDKGLMKLHVYVPVLFKKVIISILTNSEIIEICRRNFICLNISSLKISMVYTKLIAE